MSYEKECILTIIICCCLISIALGITYKRLLDAKDMIGAQCSKIEELEKNAAHKS